MRREYRFYVYILTNNARKITYIGFTNNITRRIIEHRESLGSVFSKKYRTTILVYYEESKYVNLAIAREKEIKKWRREKKWDLIKTGNPALKDLSAEIFESCGVSKEDYDEILYDLKNRRQ